MSIIKYSLDKKSASFCFLETVIELSCCYETNFVKARNYNIESYSKLRDLCIHKNFRVTKLYVEVSSLRVLSKNLQEFRISATNMTA